MSSREAGVGRDPGPPFAGLGGLPAAADEDRERRTQSVLEERARALARPVGDDRVAETIEVILLRLAGERYAIESHFVFEAIRSAEIAMIPGAQPPVFGLTAWRGDLLTLLDLRSALELPSLPEAAGEVLVVGEAQPAFGLLVDRAEKIQEIPVSDVRPHAESSGQAGRFVRGVTSDAVVVIDAAKLIRTFP